MHFIVYYSFVATGAHTYIKILNYHKSFYIFRCFCTIFREILYCVRSSYQMLKLLELHNTVDRCAIKSVLLVKCGIGCICKSKALFWCVECASRKGTSTGTNFVNSTYFTIKRSTVLCKFNNFKIW